MAEIEKLKVLVVDDTIVYRKIISEVLTGFPNVEIVGTANNGKTAVSRIVSLSPDLITLDVDMPGMDGIQVLEEINRLELDVGVVMLSSLTHEGGELTVRALELGAFDFIPKPELSSISDNKAFIRYRLGPMLRSFSGRREIKRILSGKTKFRKKIKETLTDTQLKAGETLKEKIRLPGIIGPSSPRVASKIVAIGISTGGPRALARLIPNLPADIGVPVVIVQHMPPLFTQSLAKSLNAKSALTVKEAEDGECLQANTVYIAPGGHQMKIGTSGGEEKIIRVTEDPPENSCRPSVDYLFRSVAGHYGQAATAVIMTGMGTDGNRGLGVLKKANAFLIAQDEATCTVFGMPKWPIEANIVDVVASLDAISQEILNSVKPSG
ncbi:MAG: chemotaxis response regulator protein-glutamate methylesterase [Thermodesulfobacteriota bacterium]|nr:chemotaxis response regulator protein-glutamate methylesterase [Thermodesulfobacteriota bacterium]